MKKTFPRGLTPLVAALASPAALAVNLGELHTRSALGSPLDAYIEIYSGPEERAENWQVDILSDTFAGPLSAPAAVGALSGQLAKSADGSSYIRLASASPVDAATLAFRLRLSTPNGALIGRYTITLRPPSLAVPRVTVPRTLTVRRQPRARATALVLGADTYGPVRRGESLWSIARKTAGGRKLSQVMREIHASNPSAFTDGNIDRLRTGVMLVLGPAPSVPVVAAVVPPPLVNGTPREAPKIPPPRPPASAVAPLRKSVARDPLLTARLAVLDEKFAAIRARYGPQAVALLPANGAPALTAPALALTAPALAPALALTTPKPAAALTPPATARVATPAPNASAAGPAPTFAGAGPYWLLGALAAAAAVGAWKKTRGKRAGAGAPGEQSDDSLLRAEVARKSGNRVRLENEIRALIEPTGAQPNLTNARATRLHEEQPMPSGVVIAEASDIDTSIAQGQYVRAESLLQTVIQSAPRNAQAKLRLAEVYYITEQVEPFAALALEVKQLHRAEVSDDDWQRLVRMGKILAPEFSLFSGPTPVGLSA
ncbi:MAG: hypothetical protein EXR83_05030 [Gammaproteobacteria bacterium]|nr:hypothetical protein [Gammaproteobacteria bacterium]